MDEKLQIPVEGNLGLLAYGAKGVMAWRQAREKAENEKQSGNEEK